MVIIAFTLTITSCSQSFYQVYEVKSENMKQEDNSLVYEMKTVGLCIIYGLKMERLASFSEIRQTKTSL